MTTSLDSSSHSDSHSSSDATPITVCVLGGGNFGTVIANILAENGHTVRLWVRRQALADDINQRHENAQYLPGVAIHEGVTAYTDLATCVDGMGIVFMSIPSKSVQQVASQVAPHLEPNAIVVSTTKGIQTDGFKLMSELLEEEFDGHPVVAMSGPNIAPEIAQKQFSATVVAHESLAVCDQVADILHNAYFRVYSNTDRFSALSIQYLLKTSPLYFSP
ncbi:MAG: 2-dehydropantoate 2-reductase N-terminal domain-containing protein [Pseudomonadota bacterium]